MKSPRELGRQVEGQARAFLERQGLSFVTANYRTPRGEIDLVMRDRDTLIFVEVRYRRDNRFGGAAASVDARKQSRLVMAAQHYLQRLGKTPACRFDIVAVSGPDAPDFDWLRNAFQASF